MNSCVKYIQNKDKIKIEIKINAKSSVVFGIYLFIVIPTLLLSGITIFAIFSDIKSLNIDILYIILLNFILFFISLKYLNRLYEKEILTLDSKILLYKKKWIFNKNEKKILLENISQVKYIDVNQNIKHPLEGESNDYLGIGTSQREVDFLIEDGKILLVSGYNIIKFGKNIDSEDGESIIQLIFKYKNIMKN